MSTYRTKETEEKYSKRKEDIKNNNLICPICRLEPIQSFKYWKIIINEFPYDLIAKKHDMLATIRHVDEEGLTAEEIEELRNLKKTYLANQDYDFIIETTHNTKTIPEHFHLHLIAPKDQEELWEYEN